MRSLWLRCLMVRGGLSSREPNRTDAEASRDGLGAAMVYNRERMFWEGSDGRFKIIKKKKTIND